MSAAPRPPRRQRCAIDGVLLLNKPLGITSQQAVSRVRTIYCAAKAGHTGTLDPMADGLLPVCLGEATKFAHMLLDADKEYLASVRLGVTTTTGDAEGEIIERNAAVTDAAAIAAAITRFRGEIMQVPPMYSALKRDGVPLYEYARKGIEVERKPRRICIHDLAMLEINADLLRLRVRCSKGTYIRVLAQDIGKALGCGASLAALTRTGVGGLRLDDDAVHTLDQLAAMSEAERCEQLLPADALLQEMVAIELDAFQTGKMVNGQTVTVEGTADQGLVRMYGPQRQFLGIAEASEGGRIAPRRLIAQPALVQRKLEKSPD